MRFKRVYLEISNICNIQCSFCPVVERDKKIMSIEEFKTNLKQIKPFTEEICLHLMGEPLAHPKIKEILQICDHEKIKIMITTNGLLIKRYQDILLEVNCVRQINFSLQSFKDNFPHKDLRQYLMPILGFSLLAHEKKPEMYINYRLWNYDIDRGENEEIYQEIEKFYDIEVKRKVDVGNIKSKRIWNRVYLHFDSRFEWPSFDLPNLGDKGRCHGMTSHIGVHADGTVVPCCLDKESNINLGNIYETDFKSIIESKRAMAMTKGFEEGKLVESFCQHCSFIKRFD